MISLLTKPIEQIDIDDIQSLIEKNVPENERIEFKCSLSSSGTKLDPWYEGKKISERARNNILMESVAFANAFGGALILGIGETKDKQPTAGYLNPIPRCGELVENLKMNFRDCVEPEIPQIEIFAVLTNGSSGIVILRTGRSFRAPHRVMPNKVCPIRRLNRCEQMSMREIQDLTLNLNRGIEGLNQKLSGCSTRFKTDKFQKLEGPNEAFGVRVSAVPILDEVKLHSVYQLGKLIESLSPPCIEIERTIGDSKNQLKDVFGFFGSRTDNSSKWRPMLRGASSELFASSSANGYYIYGYREIFHDGLLESGFLATNEYTNPKFNTQDRTNLNSEVLIHMFAQILMWAEKIRNQAGAPTAEYLIETEFIVKLDETKVETEINSRNLLRVLPKGTKVFPRYSYSQANEISNLVALFERDFWNFLGDDIGEVPKYVIQHSTLKS